MIVLSERVTDLLEETHKAANRELVASEEYRNFEKTYSDDVVTRLQAYYKEYLELETRKEQLEYQLNNFGQLYDIPLGGIRYGGASSIRRQMDYYIERKKEEAFPTARFDRDKTLRRVQADILLSDVDNPDELVKSLVEKLKDNG